MRSLARLTVLVVFAALAGCSGWVVDGTGGSGLGYDPAHSAPGWRATGLGSGFEVLRSATFALDRTGAPMLAHWRLDGPLPHLRRWNGASWVDLGVSPVLTDGATTTPTPDYWVLPGVAPATTPDGAPVVVFADSPNSAYGTLRATRFASGTWTRLPDPPAQYEGDPDAIQALSTPGGIVIAWGDTVWDKAVAPAPSVVRVARLEGTVWVELGGPRVSQKPAGLAAGPDGAPVMARLDEHGIWVVDRWDEASQAWTTLAALPYGTEVWRVSVGVDSTGAVYATGTDSIGTETWAVDAVRFLAPGATQWTSLGLPPGFGTTNDRLPALAGLPGGGVALAWTDRKAMLARHLGVGWESITAVDDGGDGSSQAPAIGVISRDALLLAFTTSGAARPQAFVVRYARQ